MNDNTKDSSTPPKTTPTGHSGPGSTYNTIADKVGGVPSFRVKDNIIQGIVVLVLALVGAVVGGLLWGVTGALGLGLGGMIAGVLLSGVVLMVLGLMRKTK